MPRLARDVNDVALFGFELIEPFDLVADVAEHDQPECTAFLVIMPFVAGLRRLIPAHDDVGEAAIGGDEPAAALFTSDDLVEVHDLTILRVQHAASAVDARLYVLKAGHRR